MRLKKYSCTFVVAARFGDRKELGRGPSCYNASASPCHFTSRGSLVTRIDLAFGSLTVWTGEDYLLCDTTTKDCIETKKLAADGEVAYSERALGVNIELNPRKRIGIILAAVTLAIGGVGEQEISEIKLL